MSQVFFNVLKVFLLLIGRFHICVSHPCVPVNEEHNSVPVNVCDVLRLGS